MIEHLSAEAGLLLFRELQRCLKTGGYCRLVTPDMDLYLERYFASDWLFFLRANGEAILKRVCKGILLPESLLMHNQLVKAFASYSGRMDNGGGPILQKQQVDEKLACLSKYQFRDWCVSLLEPERVYAHIHLYDYQELRSALELAGFQNIRRTSWGTSGCDAMTNPAMDLKKHQMYSLYVEAIK